MDRDVTDPDRIVSEVVLPCEAAREPPTSDAEPGADTPESVPATERCVYVPDLPTGRWHAERLVSREVLITEPVDSAPDTLPERPSR
jgi:hypothetical protein